MKTIQRSLIAAICGFTFLLLNRQTVERRRSLRLRLPTRSLFYNSNHELEKRIQELEYINSMLLARSRAVVTGPISLSSLTKSQQTSFNNWNMKLQGHFMHDGTDGKSNPQQVPPQVIEHGLMDRTENGLGWKKVWSKKLVDYLINSVRKNEDISPRDFPGSALQVQQAMEDYVNGGYFPEFNQRIMVAGSISPWVESIALAVTGASKVWVVDYQPIDMGDEDRIEYILMEDLQLKKPDDLFDIIVSFSSIEHDGLGRYGDPINPEGDLAAVAEFWTLLNPGGLLMLAVPYVDHPSHNTGFVMGNLHRQYSSDRFQALCKGFEVLEAIQPGTKELANRFYKPFESVEIMGKGTSWQNQPLVVMRKSTEEVPVMLEKFLHQ